MSDFPDGLINSPQPSISVIDVTPIIIVEHPTGVRFWGQVAGILCAHPAVEGFPLEWSIPEGSPMYGVSCDGGCCGFGLPQETIDRIQAAWPQFDKWASYIVEFDAERAALAGSEAWFPVRFKKNPTAAPWLEREGLAAWLDGKTGWLLMPDNCD